MGQNTANDKTSERDRTFDTRRQAGRIDLKEMSELSVGRDRNGIASDGRLDQRQAQAPYVRLDRVAVALESLGRHVRSRANERVGHGVNQLTANAEVAQLDLARRVDEYVGRLDVSMHDRVLVAQIAEALEHRLGDLAEYGLGYAIDLAEDEVERAAVHVLHADGDLAVAVEGAVEADYVGRVALVQDGELAQYLVANGRLDLEVNELLGHDGARLAVTHLEHDAAVARAELALHRQVVVGQIADLLAPCQELLEFVLLLVGDVQLLDHVEQLMHVGPRRYARERVRSLHRVYHGRVHFDLLGRADDGRQRWRSELGRRRAASRCFSLQKKTTKKVVVVCVC